MALLETIPLEMDAHGAYRVGGTRVTLDLVVRAFERGATAEEIVHKFPALQLADIYQVLGYYLNHNKDLGKYLSSRAVAEEAMVSEHPEWSPAGLRERLMARSKSA